MAKLTVFEVVNRTGVVKVFRTRTAAEAFQEKLVAAATKLERLGVVVWIRQASYSNSVR